MLVGLALAVNLLQFGEPFDRIVFSMLLTIGYLVWTMFLIRARVRYSRQWPAATAVTTAINPQTLPLFQNMALITIVVISVYVIFTAWNVDMTAWLASAGIIGIAVGFAAKDTLANLVFRCLYHGRCTLQDWRFRGAGYRRAR